MSDFQAPGPTPQDPVAKPPSVAPPAPSVIDNFGQKFRTDEFWKEQQAPGVPSGEKVRRPYAPDAVPEPSQEMRPGFGPEPPPEMVQEAERARQEQWKAEGQARFMEAFRKRRIEIMARNRGATPKQLESIMGDEWGMLAIQKQRAEQMGMDSNRFWEGTDILNQQLVTERWTVELGKRLAMTHAKMADPEIAMKIDNLQASYDSLLARHEAVKKHTLTALSATKDPKEREALINSIFPIVAPEEWEQWQADIEGINGALGQFRSGLNLFNHPDTKAMAKGLSTTIWQGKQGAFLQKGEPVEKEEAPGMIDTAAAAVGSTVDAFAGTATHAVMSMGRLMLQQGVNLKNWIEGDPTWDIGAIEDTFQYTYDKDGKPVWSGGSFGSAEVLATMMGALGREQAAVHLAAMGRSDREIRQTFDDHTISGFLNAGGAAIGSVFGYQRMFLQPSLRTMAKTEALLASERAAHLAGKAVQAQDLLARSVAFIAGGTKTARAIRRTAGLVAGGAHSAILHGAATGSLQDFGRAAMTGFAMIPVNMVVGAYGSRLEAALLGGKLRGPLWNTAVRAIRGVFEGAGFGMAGAGLGVPLDPLFDAGSPENELLQNYLHNPNGETSAAFFNYMGQWIFGQMVGQAAFGRSDTRHAIESRRQRAERKDLKIKTKISEQEIMEDDKLSAYQELVDEERAEPIMRALRTMGGVMRAEAKILTEAEKRGLRYQPIVDILEAGGGKMEADEKGNVTIHLNDNLMARLIRGRVRAMSRFTDKIDRGERAGEVKGIDEIGMVVGKDPQGGWIVKPFKGVQGGLMSGDIFGVGYDAVAHAQGVLQDQMDKTQVTLIHSHPFASGFSDADIIHFRNTNWSKDAPKGGEYAPQVQINAEGGYVVRPKGRKVPNAAAPWSDSKINNAVARSIIEKGMRGEMGEVLQKYLNTRFEGDVQSAYEAYNNATANYLNDRKLDPHDRPMMSIATQAWHLAHQDWADRFGFDYAYFEPKTMAKKWDEYMRTGKFDFSGGQDPLAHVMLVGTEVEKRLAQQRREAPPPKPAPTPAPAPKVEGPETLKQVEQRLRDWQKDLAPGSKERIEAGYVLEKKRGEHQDLRRRRLLNYLAGKQAKAEQDALEAEPTDERGTFVEQIAPPDVSAPDYVKVWEVLKPREGETQEQRLARIQAAIDAIPAPVVSAQGKPDYVKVWEVLKPREGETQEQRLARIQAEIDAIQAPVVSAAGKPDYVKVWNALKPREGETHEQRMARLQAEIDAIQAPGPSDRELADAGRMEIRMAKGQPPPTPPTVDQQRHALRKGFEQQRSYWESAQTFNKYVVKVKDATLNFFKNYFTDKEYRKELAHQIRNRVGYGAKFLVLGPDEDHIKAQADVLRQSVTLAAKNARVLRSRIFHQILADESLKPEQRQNLIDEVLQYGVLRDLEANSTRPFKETVMIEDTDPTTGQPAGTHTAYKVLRRVPRELPFGVTPEAVRAERMQIEARLTDAQRSAYVNIRASLDAAWDSMVALGLATNEFKIPDYFPHKILDWSEADHPGIGTTLPKQRPVRPYLMGREGSRRMFDTSIRAIQDYLIKVDVQNAKHNFLDVTARNIHLRALREQGLEHMQWEDLNADQWKAHREHMEEEGYVLLDTRYGRTGKESLERTEIVQKILSDIETEAGIPMMPEVVVGRSYRPNEDKGIYFVTKEYAEFIRAQFSSAEWQMAGLKAANRMIGKWIKGPMLRGLLGTSGVERSVRNLASDLHGIFMKGDGFKAVTGTLANWKPALKIIHAYRTRDIDPKVVETLTPYEFSILQEMEARGTLQANVRGQEFTRDDPIETEWMEKTMPEVRTSVGRMLSKMYRSDFKWAKALDDYSENLLRVAYFMRERMERFKTLERTGVDPESRDQLAADYAHLRTGEVLVNYNHLTPIERHGLNGVIFPFYTWAKSNFFETMAVAVERPMTTAARAALTAAPFIVWNSLMAKDEEERLWEKNPNLASKPHLILPWIRDSFGNPMVLAWDSTMGEALGFLGMNQLADDTFQYFTGHGDADILAKDIIPGAFENMKNKWKNFTAPWVRAVTTQVFESEFASTGERAEQFFDVDIPQISRPWAELQSMLELNRKERSPETRWVQFAPFVGFPDMFEGVTGEALPQHYMAGRLQRREAQLTKAIGNNIRRFTTGLRAHDTEMMTAAVQRVWDDMGEELMESGIEPIHLVSRFVDRAIGHLGREELIKMGLTPKWLQLSKSQQAVLLLQLMERNK